MTDFGRFISCIACGAIIVQPTLLQCGHTTCRSCVDSCRCPNLQSDWDFPENKSVSKLINLMKQEPLDEESCQKNINLIMMYSHHQIAEYQRAISVDIYKRLSNLDRLDDKVNEMNRTTRTTLELISSDITG